MSGYSNQTSIRTGYFVAADAVTESRIEKSGTYYVNWSSVYNINLLFKYADKSWILNFLN
jgi:hypothetical protein